MGFWNSLGEGLKKASEKAADYQAEVEKQMERYDYKSDDELLAELKRGGPMAKNVAIRKLLQERGVINS